MSNPYQSPSLNPKQFQDYPTQLPYSSGGFGWVSQIRIVAILNCVQGGLEVLMGLMMIGAAAFVPLMVQMDQRQGGVPPPKEMVWILPAIYLAIGIPVLLAAILRIYAGIQNFRFRKRTLGIVSLICGLVSFIGCYCAPTGIAMLIYGLIVYLNPAVRAAFEMAEGGMPTDAVLSSFLPYPQAGFQPPPFPPPTDKGAGPV